MLGTFFSLGGSDFTFLGFRAFCDNNVGKPSSFLVPCHDPFHDAVDVVWYLRYQAYLSATSDGSVKRDPACIAAHYFHDHDPMMTFRRSHKLVEAVGGDLNCSLKSKRYVR